MKKSKEHISVSKGIDRREALQRVAVGVVAVPFLHACSDDTELMDVLDGGTSVDLGTTSGDAGAIVSDAGVVSDSGTTSDAGATDSGAVDAGAADTGTADTGQADSGAAADAGVVDGWATGGTPSMTAKASYPDPFTSAPTSCLVVDSTTEGPCTTSTDIDREDVSEGWDGLPVRFALRIVDSSCNPLSGVTVKIWHTNYEGIYSGQTPNPRMCNDNNSSYIAQDFMRGVQTTDSNGVVYFDTCFPGWYNGRAVHIHFQVKSGSRSYRVSQLFFPEATTSEIFSTHPVYSSFGQPDTVFSTDNIMRNIATSDWPLHTMEVSRMSDGAMLASKTVAVTS